MYKKYIIKLNGEQVAEFEDIVEMYKWFDQEADFYTDYEIEEKTFFYKRH